MFQGRNRDTDIENKPVDTAGEGEGGRNWESSVDIYTLPCVKQMASFSRSSLAASGKPLYNIGSSAQCSVMT